MVIDLLGMDCKLNGVCILIGDEYYVRINNRHFVVYGIIIISR